MIEIKPVSDFNLYHTLSCGQAFRWYEDDGWFYGVVNNKLLKICQEDNTLLVESSDESDPKKLQQYLWHYFDLGRDLSRILDERFGWSMSRYANNEPRPVGMSRFIYPFPEQ